MVRLITAIFLISALAACNTLHGVGKDLEEAGEAVQRKAK